MKQLLLIFSLILFVFLAGCNNTDISENTQSELNNIQEVKTPLTPTQENFIKILKTNKDGKEYLEKYPNTKIISFKKIIPTEFEMLKNQTEYKELYIDLPQKELYQVDFNGGTSLSLTTIIDLEEEKVVKIYGIYLIGMG